MTLEGSPGKTWPIDLILRRQRGVLTYYANGSTVHVIERCFHLLIRELRMTTGHTDTDSQPLTHVVFHVLLAMEEGARYGYAIMQHAEEASGLRMGPGTVYGAIQRMEDGGLVRESDLPGDGRRKVYEMTPRGGEALRTEAARLDRLASLARELDLVPGADAL